jgi:fructokinase
VQQVAERADAIVFGSLAQRAPISRATIRRAVAAARESAWRLFDVNLRQSYYDADVLAKSLELARKLSPTRNSPSWRSSWGSRGAAPQDLLRALCERFELKLVALTRGACGSLLVTPDAVSESAAPRTVVVDTVGAGDAFTAALLIGMLAGYSLDEVSRRANAVAAYVCSQPGATPAIPKALVQGRR